MDKLTDDALDAVGARLRALRKRQEMTLSDVADATRISVSTLSRLEAGQRRPNLELLLPLARVYGVRLDDLLAASPTEDPRIHSRAFVRNGRTFLPLTRRPGGLQAYKVVIAPSRAPSRAKLQSHEGYEWLYVLNGKLRLVLGGHDLVLQAGEAAEFDTRVPHSIECEGTEPLELLMLFGPQGEKLHIRARPARR